MFPLYKTDPFSSSYCLYFGYDESLLIYFCKKIELTYGEILLTVSICDDISFTY